MANKRIDNRQKPVHRAPRPLPPGKPAPLAQRKRKAPFPGAENKIWRPGHESNV